MTKSGTKTAEMSELCVVRRWAGNSESWLTSFMKSLPSIPNVVSVIVMGSAVRERGHRRSDFDLLILYRGKRPSIEAPLEVDVRAYPIDGIENKLAQGHEIIGWAIKFGAAIYDKDCIWRNLQASWEERV